MRNTNIVMILILVRINLNFKIQLLKSKLDPSFLPSAFSIGQPGDKWRNVEVYRE